MRWQQRPYGEVPNLLLGTVHIHHMDHLTTNLNCTSHTVYFRFPNSDIMIVQSTDSSSIIQLLWIIVLWSVPQDMTEWLGSITAYSCCLSWYLPRISPWTTVLFSAPCSCNLCLLWGQTSYIRHKDFLRLPSVLRHARTTPPEFWNGLDWRALVEDKIPNIGKLRG